MNKQQRWDQYFYSICNVVGSNSKCLSRQIGAVLVKDKVIICTGYNGPPRGIPHCEGDICPRRKLGFKSGEGLEKCPAAHAERNAIIQAARLGIKVKDSVLYLNTSIPCKDCLIEIINAGIIEVVCTEDKLYDELSEFLIKKITLFGGFNIRQFSCLVKEEKSKGIYLPLTEIK